jgi:hypothetical protein
MNPAEKKSCRCPVKKKSCRQQNAFPRMFCHLLPLITEEEKEKEFHLPTNRSTARTEGQSAMEIGTLVKDLFPQGHHGKAAKKNKIKRTGTGDQSQSQK